MPLTRQGPACDDAFMTKRYTIERAYSPEGPDGWDLFEDGEWANRFSTRQEARDAMAALKGSP